MHVQVYGAIVGLLVDHQSFCAGSNKGSVVVGCERRHSASRCSVAAGERSDAKSPSERLDGVSPQLDSRARRKSDLSGNALNSATKLMARAAQIGDASRKRPAELRTCRPEGFGG